MQSRFKLKLNVSYQLKDRFGNIKPIWQKNGIHTLLIKLFGARVPKIPLLLGFWATEKNYSNLVTDAGKAGGLPHQRVWCCRSLHGYRHRHRDNRSKRRRHHPRNRKEGRRHSGRRRHALATASVTVSRVTIDVTNDTAQLAGTIAVTGTMAVTESGVFNADTNGTLLARQVFSPSTS
jgi:hypothetical protein